MPSARGAAVDANGVLYADQIPSQFVTTDELNQALAGYSGGGGGGTAGSVAWDNITGRPPIEVTIIMPGGADRARVNTNTGGLLGTGDFAKFVSPVPPKLGGQFAQVNDSWELNSAV